MTRFFYDLEFIEDGRTIDLISVGIVREDGLEYYAVNLNAPWSRIAEHEWLVANVVCHLPRTYGDQRLHEGHVNTLALDFSDQQVRTQDTIAHEVKDFLKSGDSAPELWADCGDYDHVCLMQLYGDMSTKPKGFPYYTHDLRQEIDRLGNPPVPDQPSGAHNALDDAQHGLTTARALGIWPERLLVID